MTKSTITIEIKSGVHIHDAYVEAIRLARLLNVDVRFTFNGIKCHTTPKGDPDEGAAHYHKLIRK